MPESIVPYLDTYKLKLSNEFAIDAHYLQKGHWESHLLSYIQYFVKPGDICVDVGANVGFHTIAMADACGDSGRVYAFEPSTVTFPRLVDNINLNRELKSRIVSEKLGLSDKAGNLKLFASGDLKGNAYMAEEQNPNLWNATGPEEFELCIVETLDEYLPEQSKIDFMKIDVEGMELEVLQGAVKTIQSNVPVIVYETLVDCFDKKKIKACEDLLAELGYHFFFLHPKLQKLAPVRAPNLAEDTLAIHVSQIPRYGEIMFNAAQYHINQIGRGTTDIVDLELTIVGMDKDLFTAKLLEKNSGSEEVCSTSCKNGKVSLVTSILGSENTLSLELFQKDDSEAAEGCDSSSVAIEGSSLVLAARRQGGKIFNRSFFVDSEKEQSSEL